MGKLALMDKEIEPNSNSKTAVNENLKTINTCIHFETLAEPVKKSCPLFNSLINRVNMEVKNPQKHINKKRKNIISKTHNNRPSMGPALGEKVIDCNNDIPTMTIGDYAEILTGNNQFTEMNSINQVIRGDAKSKLGNYQAAIVDYNLAIACNPNDSIAYRKRAVAEINLCDYEQALLDLNKSIRINPDDGETYTYRGMGKAKQGNYVGALADFNKSIEINPFDEVAYHNRGNVKYNLRNKIGASLDWSKAGELRMRRRWKDYNNVFQKKQF